MFGLQWGSRRGVLIQLFLPIFIFAGVLAGLVGFARVAMAPGKNLELTVLATGDVRGYVDPCG